MAPRDTGELAESIKLKPTKVKGKTKQYLLEVSDLACIFSRIWIQTTFCTDIKFIEDGSRSLFC